MVPFGEMADRSPELTFGHGQTTLKKGTHVQHHPLRANVGSFVSPHSTRSCPSGGRSSRPRRRRERRCPRLPPIRRPYPFNRRCFHAEGEHNVKKSTRRRVRAVVITVVGGIVATVVGGLILNATHTDASSPFPSLSSPQPHAATKHHPTSSSSTPTASSTRSRAAVGTALPAASAPQPITLDGQDVVSAQSCAWNGMRHRTSARLRMGRCHRAVGRHHL
jgi:hypothetical protein